MACMSIIPATTETTITTAINNLSFTFAGILIFFYFNFYIGNYSASEVQTRLCTAQLFNNPRELNLGFFDRNPHFFSNRLGNIFLVYSSEHLAFIPYFYLYRKLPFFHIRP